MSNIRNKNRYTPSLFQDKNGFLYQSGTNYKDVTRPIPNSSAISSHTGRSVITTRKIAVANTAFRQVPTSDTSFKHGFSGFLCNINLRPPLYDKNVSSSKKRKYSSVFRRINDYSVRLFIMLRLWAYLT